MPRPLSSSIFPSGPLRLLRLRYLPPCGRCSSSLSVSMRIGAEVSAIQTQLYLRAEKNRVKSPPSGHPPGSSGRPYRHFPPSNISNETCTSRSFLNFISPSSRRIRGNPEEHQCRALPSSGKIFHSSWRGQVNARDWD